MHIDAHQHFWRLADRQGQWPPPALAPLYRDFAPADLLPSLQRCRIAGTVLVQSLPSLGDTEFMLELAQRHDFILGVVGWVDLKSAGAPLYIAHLAQYRKFKGLRPMLQDLGDDRWIDDPALDLAVQCMVDHGLSFDALVLQRHLPALRCFARRHPDLPIVVDHAAKPAIARGALRTWQREIAALARLPNVHCKLSGLLTEGGPGCDQARLRPCVEHVFDSFGSSRLMWGSDWPVLRLATDYDEWFAMAHSLCTSQPGVGDAELDAVFGGNAHRFYRLDHSPNRQGFPC
ncbi:amidohydrolase family protein [Variovorax sp. YR752]|uniref:amidohydrolase family protein n=1 Tax=Variovorax sp. YR752 TaxID=1884383 RepID=UPI003137FEE2